jgi:hypothetical protein
MAAVELAEPSLAELARVIKAGACIEASFKAISQKEYPQSSC